MHSLETQRTKIDKSESSIYRWNIRVSNSHNFRQRYPKHLTDKAKQGILQQNLSRYYKFERAEQLCEYFNKFVNTLEKEREQKVPEDKYPWLDPNDE